MKKCKYVFLRENVLILIDRMTNIEYTNHSVTELCLKRCYIKGQGEKINYPE